MMGYLIRNAEVASNVITPNGLVIKLTVFDNSAAELKELCQLFRTSQKIETAKMPKIEELPANVASLRRRMVTCNLSPQPVPIQMRDGQWHDARNHMFTGLEVDVAVMVYAMEIETRFGRAPQIFLNIVGAVVNPFTPVPYGLRDLLMARDPNMVKRVEDGAPIDMEQRNGSEH